jgi:hypothetical protein
MDNQASLLSQINRVTYHSEIKPETRRNPSLQLSFQTFLILRRIHRDIVINMETSSCKEPVIFVGFERNLNFRDRFSEKA